MRTLDLSFTVAEYGIIYQSAIELQAASASATVDGETRFTTQDEAPRAVGAETRGGRGCRWTEKETETCQRGRDTQEDGKEARPEARQLMDDGKKENVQEGWKRKNK